MENKNKKVAAGVLVKCNETGRILLLLRNDVSYEPNTWGLVSGGIEPGEEILEGLKREVNEEMGISPEIISYKFISKKYYKSKNLEFHYYEGLTNSEFTPKLDHENLDYGWFNKGELPEPLYPNMIGKINRI